MNILYTQEEFDSAKVRHLLKLLCSQCNKEFSVSKKAIIDSIKRINDTPKYCSKPCYALARTLPCIECKQCNKIFKPHQITNIFCNNSCAATYNNKNKTYGTRRSKAEIYIETILKSKGITCVSNGKLDGLELDILLTQYNIAIEVNGPTHYKPIYGQAKLERIQELDKLRQEACDKHNIKLIVLDVSQDTYFKKAMLKYDAFCEDILKLVAVH